VIPLYRQEALTRLSGFDVGFNFFHFLSSG